jgi:hypothetical protein
MTEPSTLGLVSFSEGTRYTAQKYEGARQWCKANNKPLPQHALYPRTKGFVTTVQHLRNAPHVKAVYDVTIAYSYQNKFLTAPTIWDTLSLPSLSGPKGSYKFHVDVQRYELISLPRADEELAQWLESKWIEKGELLERFREQWSRGMELGKELVVR